MNTQKINQIKEAIEELEYYQNGMHRLSGTSVEVRNIRIRGKKVIADIDLIYDDEKKKETHNDLEYDLKKLEVEE